MAWPTNGDYSSALQNLAARSRDPRLRSAVVAYNSAGLPQISTGNFAAVFQLTAAGTKHALRCFTRNCQDREERYEKVKEHLDTLAFPPAYLADFELLSKELLLSGTRYAVMLMQWVEGQPLGAYVDGQKGLIPGLADRFAQLVEELETDHIAHGDLQHGNILFSPQDGLWLVDYDGMLVPSLAGNPPDEVGHPNYQHPARLRTSYYEPDVDRFSALVIYVSLLAVESDPGLFSSYYNQENLLFTQADYENPGGTPVWRSVSGSRNPEVKRLAAELEQWCRRTDPAGLPALKDLLTVAPAPPPPAPTPAPVGPGAGQGGMGTSVTIVSPRPPASPWGMVLTVFFLLFAVALASVATLMALHWLPHAGRR